MSYETRKCEHIKTNGVRCGSPALRDENFCYFHHRARHDFPHRAELASGVAGAGAGHIGNTGVGNTGGAAPFPAGEGAPRTALDIPFPEDADAIQYGLGKVIYGLLNGLIDHRTAGLTLYALQTASGNLKNTSLFKRSQEADEDDRSNVSPLLAYYLGPSREDYSRVFRILQDAEADLKDKTREIAELKERLGKSCEDDPQTQPGWVERMHEATAIEPREERYSRNVEPARLKLDLQAAVDIQATAGALSEPADTRSKPACSVPPKAPCSAGGSPAVARAGPPSPEVCFRSSSFDHHGSGATPKMPRAAMSQSKARLPNPCAAHHRIHLAPVYNRESVNLS